MTDKEFRQLNRSELIDIIYEYQKQEEELRAEIAELKLQLEDRNFKITNAGSIADAVVNISGILEETQRMADEYLAAVKETGEQMRKEYLQKLMNYDEKVKKIIASQSQENAEKKNA